MTRKDYILIASAINKAVKRYKERLDISTEAVSCLVDSLSVALSEDNPRFDWERFEEACYKEIDS